MIKRKITISMKLILFIIVLMLGIAPLVLMQTVVNRTVQQNILRNSTVLTQGIMEQSHLYLNKLFRDLELETDSIAENIEISDSLDKYGAQSLRISHFNDFEGLGDIMGNLMLIDRDPSGKSVLIDITYNRVIPLDNNYHKVFMDPEYKGIMTMKNEDKIWRGSAPAGISGAKPSMWLYRNLNTAERQFIMAASINRDELLSMLNGISSTSRSEVLLISNDRKIYPENNEFLQYPFAEKALYEGVQGRFNIIYDSRETPDGLEKLMIQTYSDPVFHYNLISISPFRTLIRGFDSIVQTTTMTLVILSLGAILFGIILIYLFSRQIGIFIRAVQDIGAGRYNINLSSGCIQLEENVLLTSAISTLADEVRNSRQSLEEANENLEQKIKERTEELHSSVEELHMTRQSLIHSEQMAIMGRQGAKVAHEMNNPISVAITASSHLASVVKEIQKKFEEEKLTKKDFSALMEVSSEVSDIVQRNLRQATGMIMGFKDFASDQSRGDRKRIRLHNYVNEIIKSFSYKLKKTQFMIDFSCDEDLEIETTPSVIYQTITNLINNSLLHGFEGRSSGAISIEIKEETENIIILYKDDGNGISAENMTQLYKPFFTTKAGEGGTGLGLNIIKDLIEDELNGSIECISAPGEGVMFTVIFPINPDN